MGDDPTPSAEALPTPAALPRLEYLPEPPANRPVSVRVENDKAEIELKKVLARWPAWALGVSALLFVPVMIAASSILTIWGGGWWLWRPLVIAVGVLVVIAWVVAAIVVIGLGGLKGKAVFDGKTLFLHELASVKAIPRNRVRGVGVVIAKEDAALVDLSGTWGDAFSRGPDHALEVETPEGRLRAFGAWNREELTWVADVLGRLLDLPTEPIVKVAPSDEANPVATMNASYGRHLPWLAAGFAALGAVFLIGTLWTALPGFRSNHWPVVTGTVTHSLYEKRGDSTTAEIRYAYRVGDREHAGDEVGPFRSRGDFVFDEVVKTHPTGSAIDVRYDPARPGRAVLIPGVGWLAWLFGGCGVLLLLCGGSVWLARPTPAQERLLAAYACRVQSLNAATAVVRDAAVWTVPEATWELELRELKRTTKWMAVRIAGLVAGGLLVMWLTFGPFVPTRVWVMLPLLPGFLVAALLFEAFRPRLARRRQPAEYSIDEEGVHLPRKEHPLRPWRLFTGFSVSPHPLAPAARQVHLWLKEVATRAVVLTLPDGDDADRVIRAIERHLPPTTPDERRRREITRGSISFGATLALVYGVAVGLWVGRYVGFENLPTPKSLPFGLRMWIIVGPFVLGPGLIWLAVDAVRRRSFVPNHIASAVMFNVLGNMVLFLCALAFLARQYLP